MNQSDWKDAPKWAEFLTVDDDGTLRFHERKPFCEGGVWLSDGWTESGSTDPICLPRPTQENEG